MIRCPSTLLTKVRNCATPRVIGSCAAIAAGLMPPAEWARDDTLRGLLGLWSPVLLPAVGAALGALRPVRRA